MTESFENTNSLKYTEIMNAVGVTIKDLIDRYGVNWELNIMVDSEGNLILQESGKAILYNS